jgi:hypothetical protein
MPNQPMPSQYDPTKLPTGRADGNAQDQRGMFGQTQASTGITQNNLLNELTNKIKSQRAAVLKNLFGM